MWDKVIKKGDIVVVKAGLWDPGLSPWQRAFVCDGRGFGCNPTAMGTAIYGEWLDGTGKERIERYQISVLETEAFNSAIEHAEAIVKYLKGKEIADGS